MAADEMTCEYYYDLIEVYSAPAFSTTPFAAINLQLLACIMHHFHFQHSPILFRFDFYAATAIDTPTLRDSTPIA